MRNRIMSSFSAAVTLAFFGAVAFLHAASPELTAKKVKDNVYVVEGGVSNSTIIIGQGGVIVVDAETGRPTAGNLLLKPES